MNSWPLANSPRRVTPYSKIPIHLLPQSPYGLQARYYHRDCSNATTPRYTGSAPSSSSQDNDDSNPKTNSLPKTSDPDLPHLTASQTVHMTQITSKPVTPREATATCNVYFSNSKPATLLREGQTKKGDVFSVARIAGIMAAKKTPDLVPLCHPGIGITGVEVDVRLVGQHNGKEEKEKGDEMGYGSMLITATVGCLGRTGVEMEAMTSTMGAALTVYDMLKAVDKGMIIGGVRLLEKKGGKSGHWVRENEVEKSA